MSGIVADIEAEIGKLKSEVTKKHTGNIREIGDGVAKIEGL